MPRTILLSIVFLAIPANGRAGTVHFNPTEAVVDADDPFDDLVKMDVSFESPAATSVLIVLAFEGGPLEESNFVPSPSWCHFFGGCAGELPDGSLQLEGFGFTPNDQALSGSLTIDTGHLSPGEYNLVATGEAQQADTTADPLSGEATITVVPEPGALVLLGLGTVAGLRREWRVKKEGTAI